MKHRTDSREPTRIRWGYSFFGSAEDLDPLEINSIYQSNLIENIYSRIVEYDNAGQIVCSLCSSFSVEENSLIFQFDNDSKTIGGALVGANDARVSLDRILVGQSNTHGSLKYYLRGDSAEALKVSEGNLRIEVLKPEWIPFVLSLLTSMDFSIIPIQSIDYKTNKIIDYQNTSGLYFVDKSVQNGNITLKANIYHSSYKKQMIDEISIVPIKSGEAHLAFLDNKIDIIDPTYYAYQEDLDKITAHLQDSILHTTLPIGLTALVFSNDVVGKTEVTDRVAAAEAIKQWFLKETPKIYGAEETDQYFQSFGKGFISSDQKKYLQVLKTTQRKSKQKFVLGLTEKYRQWTEEFEFPNFIELRFYATYPGFLPENERPDIYLMTTDSSFDEDISALSYLFSQKIFSLNKQEGAEWIQRYMSFKSRDQRIAELRELHFEMLKNVKVYPIIARPYVAVSTNAYSMSFPKLYAGSPMWKVWKR